MLVKWGLRLRNLHITGYTFSSDFPVGAVTGNVIHQSSLLGIGWAADAFVVKFDKNGLRQWATYYGISNTASVFGAWPDDIATDGNNNIFLLMEEEDAYLDPVIDTTLADACAWQPTFGGKVDQIIVKFVPNGKKTCATYMGGTGEDELDQGGGIAIFGNSLYITGVTDGGYPVSPGAWQTVCTGAFVASLCTNICEGKALGINYTASTSSVCTNLPVTFTPSVANSCDTTGYTYHWTFTGGTPASSDSVKPTVIFSGVGTHDIKLVLTTICKKDSLIKRNYITSTQCVTCNLVGQFTKGTANCNGCGCKEWIIVNATGGTSPYTYLWPDGYTNRYKNQLCPGVYNINIKDKNGCSVNVSLTTP